MFALLINLYKIIRKLSSHLDTLLSKCVGNQLAILFSDSLLLYGFPTFLFISFIFTSFVNSQNFLTIMGVFCAIIISTNFTVSSSTDRSSVQKMKNVTLKRNASGVRPGQFRIIKQNTKVLNNLKTFPMVNNGADSYNMIMKYAKTSLLNKKFVETKGPKKVPVITYKSSQLKPCLVTSPNPTKKPAAKLANTLFTSRNWGNGI